jgi:multidrug resistance efflux pump
LRIDPADAQSALDTARAEVAEAEADLRDAERGLALARDELAAAEAQARLRERALERQRDLLKPGASDRKLGGRDGGACLLGRDPGGPVAAAGARAGRDAARPGAPALERRRIALAEAERRLSDTEIAAQFAGVLSDVSVVQGGLVSPGERIAQIVDPDALEVVFRVSTSQYARLLDDRGGLSGCRSRSRSTSWERTSDRPARSAAKARRWAKARPAG